MRILIVSIAVVLVLAMVLAAAIAFDAPKTPPVMPSVAKSLDRVDFSDLPAMSHFTARDGTALATRAYPGDPARVVILVHGSSGTTASMHAVAQALHRAGATVYALAMRGHDHTGRMGDVDYVGQLDDDVADFVATHGARKPGERRVLVGFSSGGGFALRIAGGPYGKLFDRYVLVSPFLRYDAPTTRANGGGWTRVAVARIAGLTALDRLGIHRFDYLPIIAFAVAPEMMQVQTAFYTYRMMRNFQPHDDYLGDLARAPAPVALVVGEKDEIFKADQYAPLLKPVRPDLAVTIVPGVNHMGMIATPEGTRAIAAAALARDEGPPP